MIPKRVALENFLSFGPKAEIAFTDDEPLWVLGGPNGVGKSAVFDAVTFCLFGAHRGGAKEIDPLVRHGSNGFAVSFEFEFCGDDFRIARNRVGGKSTQSVERRTDGGRWERVQGINSVADVRAWAERTLGLGFDAFTASVLLRQGEADAIITAGGAERLKILKKIIGAENYEGLSKRVHEATRGKVAELDRLTTVREKTPTVSDEQLVGARAAAGAAEADRRLAEAAKTAAAGRVGLATRWAALEEKRRRLADKIVDADARAADAERIRRDKARVDELAAVLPTAKQVVPLRELVGEGERRLGDVRAEHARAAADLEGLTKQCEGLRLRIVAHRDTAADHAKQANDHRAGIGQQEKFLTAAVAVAALDAQLKGYDPDLDDRAATADRAHAVAADDERTANEALTKVVTLLGQARKEQKQFASVEVGVKCSRCLQAVTAGHAEAERKRIADMIADLTSGHETAVNRLAAAVNERDAAGARKQEFARLAAGRTALRQRLEDQRRNLEVLGGTADVTRLREEIARLTADARGFEQTRDAERALQEAAEGELKRAEAESKRATGAWKKLATDLDALEKQVVADATKLATLAAQLPEPWRATTASQLSEHTAEHDRLRSSKTAERFRQLEDDAALRDEWGRQSAETTAEIAGIPESARIPVADAGRLDAESRAAFDRAEQCWQAARDAVAELVRHSERYEQLKRDIAAAEADARVHGKLDDLLGKTGLQRELVRDAESQIVRLAHETARQLSDGDLSIELDPADHGGDEAFALRVRRADDPTPIGVNYLSGSQKFRVAISVALAIGRFAAGQARPLECVIIDEGFGSLDKDGLRAAADELNRLKQYLRRIVLVSHQEEFTDQFPVVIRLTKGDTGTTATAVRR